MLYSDKAGFPQTDASRWRLHCDAMGATEWRYLEGSDEELKHSPQSWYVKQSLNNVTPREAEALDTQVNSSLDLAAEPAFNAALRGGRYFRALQDPSGIFPMQYKGPMFMTIGYVAVCYVTKTEIPEPVRAELVRYLVNTAHPVDGGWGLHEFDKSTCFGTAINYVCLRLLGVAALNPVCVKARKMLHSLGGALKCPHWGKAWLAILNLYRWEGVNPAPPELWLLPYSYNPAHPGKWWVHTRAIYQPFSYLSATGFQGEETALVRELRAEIYPPHRPYGKINFSQHRNDVCAVDLYYPHTALLDMANYALVQYNRWLRPAWLTRRATDKVYDIILKEIQNTGGLCIAPVSYAFNACVVYARNNGAENDLFRKFMDGFKDVLFLGPQGMCVMGTNGGQVWDVSFAVQSLVISGLADLPEFDDAILCGFRFLLRSQFDTDCVENSFRDNRRGAFPYSTKAQGYTVSDCTAEAIKALIMVANHPRFKRLVAGEIDEELLFCGIDVLLSLQNLGSFHYGSFATYEKIRATPLLEKINPAEVFGNIMVEYPYVECTDSAVLGLTYFAAHYDYRAADIRRAISSAISYIKGAQNPDGSWYGCWGVCFTYAGMFALEAFSTVGLDYSNDAAVQRGCDFLVARQMADGGWGESMKSSETHTYVDSDKSLVVQTAWVVIGLILAKYPHLDVIERAVRVLIEQQQSNGEWVSEGVEGVFNHSCAIEYPNYRFVFPIKALGLYTKLIKNN